jgi:alpha 1,3-mannosyltransferase
MGVIGDTIGKGRTFAPGHEADVTMCAPQLLHLGRDGRPMWFNGWLYKNKFAGLERTLGEFEVFMEEPREVLDPEAWQMGESNMCCLSNSATREFTKKEMDWLQELLKMAKMKENLAE